MKNYRYFTILILIAIASIVHAQPNVAWWRTYDAGRVNNESLLDLYQTNEGYAACGYSDFRIWVMQLDDNGDVVWSSIFFDGSARSVIETDDGNFLIGCGINNEMGVSQFGAILVDDEGNDIWTRTYDVGTCTAVIELKSGEFLLCGSLGGQGAHVRMIEPDGETIWAENYGQMARAFYGMRETNGGVVLAGYIRLENNETRWCAVKINFLGEVIWSRVYDAEIGIRCFSIDSSPDNGFILGGYRNVFQNNRYFIDMTALKISANGNPSWSHIYANENAYERCFCVCRIPESDFVLVGHDSEAGQHIFYRINDEGGVRWRKQLDFGDDVYYDGNESLLSSVIVGHDNSIMAVGKVRLRDERFGSNALIVKLEPDILGPYFIAWSPEDTVFTTLLGDTVAFSVEAVNQQGDELSYAWYFADTLRGQNTDFEMVFDSLGAFEVQCQVSDAEFTAAITWHITVDDFFIRQILPDSLRMTVRRGSTLPFMLEVACVEPEAPTVEWSVVNRDNDREYLGEADSIDVLFDLAGEWAVEAEAIWGEERVSVRWDVSVRSAVWWWMPHEDAISVNQNDRQDFSVFPFDPDSDSLSVAWWLDGDSIDCVAEALSLDFPELGEHVLTTIAHDGIEADTIRWQITVNESGGVFDRNTIPNELALFPPAPNPFNSFTRIDYYLVQAGWVNLRLFDLSGRVIVDLVDGVYGLGKHSVTLDASGLAAGIYLAELRSGGDIRRQKVVLVK